MPLDAEEPPAKLLLTSMSVPFGEAATVHDFPVLSVYTSGLASTHGHETPATLMVTHPCVPVPVEAYAKK